MSTLTSAQKSTAFNWFLTAKSAEVASLGNISLERYPFRIGRKNGLELTLSLPTVSGNHAVISPLGNRLRLEDLGSRNGTFVNGVRIEGSTDIKPGDLLQFAETVFRLEMKSDSDVQGTLQKDDLEDAVAIVEFEQLMSEQLVAPVFQPIVDFSTGETIGFEALGRSGFQSLARPLEMFEAARRLQQEAELSQLLRKVSLERATVLDGSLKVFLNMHPCELNDPEMLVRSLQESRSAHPNRKLVLEIHESTVTDVDKMKYVRKNLEKLDIELAYDDFGSGQARFIELIEEPPAYLKFDIRLIRGIHKASERRSLAIASLVQMVHGLNVCCLAEGIETAEDAQACRLLGFHLAQGYYYSRPAPVEEFLTE